MSDLKNLVMQVRYPYTAIVIATIWLGSAALLAINQAQSIERIVLLNSVASIIIAVLGFTAPRR